MKIPSGQSPHHLQCIQSRRYTKSQLLDGQDAGLFTDVGRVANPQICTRLCCEDPSCDLAYMFGRTCFLVKCYSERSCRTIPDEDARRNDTNFDRSTQYIIKRKFGVRLRDGKVDLLKEMTSFSYLNVIFGCLWFANSQRTLLHILTCYSSMSRLFCRDFFYSQLVGLSSVGISNVQFAILFVLLLCSQLKQLVNETVRHHFNYSENEKFKKEQNHKRVRL